MTRVAAPVGEPGARTLPEAAAGALERVAAEERGAVLLTGREPGVGARFADAAPQRWVTVPGRRCRLTLGAGVALGGRRVFVLCDDAADARVAPWRQAPGLVALTGSLSVASAAWDAGATVVVPAWPADLWSVLLDSGAGGPLCVLLHDREVAAVPPLAMTRPWPAGVRTMAHGVAGRFAAAGALAPSLLEAAWRLARDGSPFTAVQLVALPPDGPAPRVAAGHVFRDAGDRWEPVPVAAPGGQREVTAAVAERLGAG